MPVYKSDNGTWYVLTRYLDWKGERKQKCKRGFETRKEAKLLLSVCLPKKPISSIRT